MRSIVTAITLVLATSSAVAGNCASATQIRYEPEVVELSGKAVVARSRHPSGTLMKYTVMRLANPVSITADGVNPINSNEACMAEVQLVGNTDAIQKKLFSANGRKLSIRGTVFHEHTAWHMRKLVVAVLEVKNEP